MVSHDLEAQFMTIDLRTNETTNTTWAVFDASHSDKRGEPLEGPLQ